MHNVLDIGSMPKPHRCHSSDSFLFIINEISNGSEFCTIIEQGVIFAARQFRKRSMLHRLGDHAVLASENLIRLSSFTKQTNKHKILDAFNLDMVNIARY